MIAAEDRPVQVTCRILGVSESGFYEQRSRPPSERAIRHAMLTELITQIDTECHGIYGTRRIHAELTLGRGAPVGHNQVELLMRRAGLQGVADRRKWKRIKPDTIATDLVERDFARSGPNQLWVTDITEHPTREGKVYCCVVLDTYSHRVVGWSIDTSPTPALVTNALGRPSTTVSPRSPNPGRSSTPTRLMHRRHARKRAGSDPIRDDVHETGRVVVGESVAGASRVRSAPYVQSRQSRVPVASHQDRAGTGAQRRAHRTPVPTRSTTPAAAGRATRATAPLPPQRTVASRR